MTTTTRQIPTVAGGALAAMMLFAAPSSAQLPNASAATLGVGDNATATVRGFAAIARNPAGLGMPDNPGFSIAVIPVQVETGLDPITLSDLKDVEGQVVSATTKSDWLSRVEADGRQSGSFGLEVSGVSLSAGRVGFQLSTVAAGRLDLSPGVVEAILYGNAGRTGTPADLSLGGSTADGFAVTTAGVSYGLPLPSESASMALGATLTYSVGHGLAMMREGSGSFRSDPLGVDVDLPVVLTDDEGYQADNGSGVGLDLGFMYRRDRVRFGAAVRNAFHTFAWDTERLVFRPGTARLEEGDNATDFEKQPFASAPSGLRTAVEETTFDPTLALGGSYDVDAHVTVSADLRNRFGDGIEVDPGFHAGAGLEYTGLEVLHLRGGAAVITDGFQLGGGATLVLGPVHLSGAVATRQGDLDTSTLSQLTVSFGGH